MKKWLLFVLIAVVASLVLGISACSNGSSTSADSSPSAPAIAKVRMWVTLSNNPDAPPVTSLTSAQTVQASIWARGTTEKTITFKVNLCYGDKFNTLAQGVRSEGSSKAVSVGALATPLEPGNYTFQAISGAFGEIVGSSLQITVTPDTSVNAPTATTPAATLSEQPDKAVFQRYFSNNPAPMGLGRILTRGNLPQELQQNVAVFAVGDQITLYGNIVKECPQPRYAIYDMQAKTIVREGGLSFPPMSIGADAVGFVSVHTVEEPIGKYEYKVYVSDMFVAVFPFEVR